MNFKLVYDVEDSINNLLYKEATREIFGIVSETIFTGSYGQISIIRNAVIDIFFNMEI